MLLIFIGIINNLCVSSQSVNKGNALSRDTSRKHLDSLIAKYEAQGLLLYNDTMYDAAIVNYTAAGDLQYTLLKKTHLFSYVRDYSITMCDVAICDYKMSCFNQSLNVLGDVSKKWMPEREGGDENFDYHNFHWSEKDAGDEAMRIYAYKGLCMGDCDLALGQFNIAATTDFNGSLYNLYINGHFPSNAILTYPNGINSYSYRIVYTELGDYLKARGDTVNAKKYYKLSSKLDSVRIAWQHELR